MTAKEQHLSPLMATIFTAMATESERTTNLVFDNYEREIEHWKEKFRTLYDAVERVNDRLDNRSLDNVLFNMGYSRDTAEPKEARGN